MKPNVLRIQEIFYRIGTVKVFGLVTWTGSCSAILRFWFDNLIWSLIDDKSKMKYQIIDFMIVLLMADQNKLKPYLYIIPSINSYINFDIKNQELFMFCYKCTEFILNVLWAPVLVCWAVVKLGGGHNCTTGPEENIGVCRRMGGGGWAGARPGQDAGFIPRPQSSTVNYHKVFRPRPRHCRLLLG